MPTTKIFTIKRFKGLKIGSAVIHARGPDWEGYQYVKAVVDQEVPKISIYKSKDQTAWEFVTELNEGAEGKRR